MWYGIYPSECQPSSTNSIIAQAVAILSQLERTAGHRDLANTLARTNVAKREALLLNKSLVLIPLKMVKTGYGSRYHAFPSASLCFAETFNGMQTRIMTIASQLKRRISHHVTDEESQSQINFDSLKTTTLFKCKQFWIHIRIRVIHESSIDEVEDQSYGSVRVHLRSRERYPFVPNVNWRWARRNGTLLLVWFGTGEYHN